jgi:hypothetical protein
MIFYTYRYREDMFRFHTATANLLTERSRRTEYEYTPGYSLEFSLVSFRVKRHVDFSSHRVPDLKYTIQG